MVLVIDTSSPRSALALVDGAEAVAEDVREGGREQDLRARVEGLVDPRRLTGVAVSLGPGSFTGLRVGVSYGLGLAMGLDLPLLGLGALELQAARATVPVVALVDAGRGRVYFQPSGGQPGHGLPAELPAAHPAVGWLRAETAAAVRAAGVRLLPEDALRSFASASARLVGTAAQLGYDTVNLRYMQSFGPARGIGGQPWSSSDSSSR